MDEPDPSTKAWPAVSLAQAHAMMTAPGSAFEMEELDIRGVRTRVWKQMTPHLAELFALARSHGDETFLVLQDERVSYEAFARAALALAEELQGAGVRKGDCVAVAMRNLPEWVAAAFGATLAGAIVVPLNAWWTGGELEYALKDSGACVLFVDAERLGRLAAHLPACPKLRRTYVARASQDAAAPSGVLRLEAVIGTPGSWGRLPDRPTCWVELGPDDDATLLYTSGTSGAPKGVLATHRNALVASKFIEFSQARAFVRRGEPMPGRTAPSARPRTLLGVPLFHTTGFSAILIPVMLLGGRLVLMRRWNAEEALRAIEAEGCTHVGGVPTIAWQLIEHPGRANADLSTVVSVSYGGAPATQELVARIGETFAAAAPGTGWGMTETSATFTHHLAEDYVHRPDSAGPAAPPNEMRIVAPDGEVLRAGEAGELWVKGPGVARGYWNKPEETARTFIDGWVRTGDLAWVDNEGFLYICGRLKDVVIRGGENILCAEVEAALYGHGAVMDAAVVPLAHPILGEEPAAVVTLKPGMSASERELQDIVAERLAAFKTPARIMFHDKPLARNPAGKLDKAAIAALFSGAGRSDPH